MVPATSPMAQPWTSRQNGSVNTYIARSPPKTGSVMRNGCAFV